ncbi:MAG: PAS domain-containing protein [Elusimicrobiota bacterium]|jgi:nitrogen fixation/metabolism regulation signal transduction histidine kinase
MAFQHGGNSWYDDEIRCIFEALPDKVFVVDADGTIIKHHTNRPEHLLALPEDFLGKKLVDFLAPGVANRLMRSIAAALSSDAPQELAFKATVVSGEERDFDARIVPCESAKVLILIRDMTDYMQAERERLEAEREAEHFRRKLADSGR